MSSYGAIEQVGVNTSGSVTQGEFKSFPKGLNRRGVNTIFPRATTPLPNVLQKNPDHVIINSTGSFYFQYDTTGSVGTTLGVSEQTQWELGVMCNTHPAAPIRLDISPCAWSGSEQGGLTKRGVNQGAVTFVYRGL